MTIATNQQATGKLLGDLLTVKEAAIYLRISMRTVNKLLADGKIGRRVLVPTKSINTFLENCYVAPIDAKAFAKSILEGRVKL